MIGLGNCSMAATVQLNSAAVHGSVAAQHSANAAAVPAEARREVRAIMPSCAFALWPNPNLLWVCLHHDRVNVYCPRERLISIRARVMALISPLGAPRTTTAITL